MNLKNRISFLVSWLFTVLFGLASTFIFVLYSNFRKEEFRDRLEIRALSSIKLLMNVKEVDHELMKTIDENSINSLYDERTLIFDSHLKLIFSNIEGKTIKWSINDLNYLKKHKSFFKKKGEYEYFGVNYKTNTTNYYVLISATDKFGARKVDYLRYVLLISYLVFTVVCWFLTSFMVKKAINPLWEFHQNIKNINENNLDTRLLVSKKKTQNEIDLLATEFNFMMDRIQLSYQKQKEFTAHASHELRTPLSRVTSQLENRISNNELLQKDTTFLKTILNDVNQITELIHSLLILSKLDTNKSNNLDFCRIDEILFASIEKTNKMYPNFSISLDMVESTNLEQFLEIKGNKSLLEIALINILKNACIYSTNKQAFVKIETIENELIVSVSNYGKTLNSDEQKQLFTPFMRGANSNGTNGFGLGLRIVKRILHLHHADVYYRSPSDNCNVFDIKFYF